METQYRPCPNDDDVNRMVSELYHVEDKLTLLAQLTYTASESDEPLDPQVLSGISLICEELFETLAYLRESLTRHLN